MVEAVAVVVERNIELVSGGVRSGGVADSEVEKPSDARALATATRFIRFAHSANLIAFGNWRISCTLQIAGEVFAPEIADRRRRAVRVGDALFYDIPVIVEEGCSRFWRDLLDTLVAYMPTR